MPAVAAGAQDRERGNRRRKDNIASQSRSLNLDAPSADTDEMEKPPLHTRFIASTEPVSDRSFWLLHTPSPHGTIFIDDGAWKALQGKHGLLPAGVVSVDGNFAAQEPVRLVVVSRLSSPNPEGRSWDGAGQEVGRALVNYSAPEIARIMGRQSSEIEELLGYADSDYVANRSDIGFFPPASRPTTPVRHLGG